MGRHLFHTLLPSGRAATRLATAKITPLLILAVLLGLIASLAGSQAPGCACVPVQRLRMKNEL